MDRWIASSAEVASPSDFCEGATGGPVDDKVGPVDDKVGPVEDNAAR
jgi:hypothetical protein